jgi:hypothetical protein
MAEASKMIVSPLLFEAYLECDTKCWLRARAEPSTSATYAEWARLKNETYYEDRRKHLLPDSLDFARAGRAREVKAEKRRENEAAAGAGDVVELRACVPDLQAFQYARAPSQADSVTHGRAQRRASRSFAARPSCPVRAATRLISSSASPGSTSTFTTCLRNFRRLRKSRIRSAGVLALRMGVLSSE